MSDVDGRRSTITDVYYVKVLPHGGAAPATASGYETRLRAAPPSAPQHFTDLASVALDCQHLRCVRSILTARARTNNFPQ